MSFRNAFTNRVIHPALGFGIALLFLAAGSMAILAQEPSGGQPSGAPGASDQNSGAAPAATGVDTQSEMSENPPVSGLDQPSFEPGLGARSYIVPKAQVSESVTSNPSASVNSTGGVGEITRLLGAVDLQKLWKIHPLDISYIGGGAWFHGGRQTQGWYQVHSMGASQRILWRTGQLAIRDTFSYLPEGSFGFGSYGGAGGFGGMGGFGGGVGFGGGGFGGGAFGSPSVGTNGNTPRIDNMGMMDVTQSLSPRTSVVLLGGYGILHFLNSPPGFVNSEQVISQVGYNYLLTRKDQIGVSYGFQEFHFPMANAGDVNINLWQVYYARRVSGRLDFTAGGGPQLIHANGYTLGLVQLPGGGIGLGLVPLKTSRISGAGRVGLNYRWSPRTNMAINYFHYVTPGSGFFPGATTDSVHYLFSHRLTRRWGMDVNTGFSRNSRILNVTSSNSAAGKSHTYDYWYSGAALRRQLSQQLQGFVSYQYNKLLFSSGFNANGSAAGYGQQIGTIGISWTGRPIRLD